jgi:hypothetical protein
MGRHKNVDNLGEKYIDFLLTTNNLASGKSFSRVFDGKISHDQITRMLNNTDTFSSAELWKTVKPLCQELASEDNVLIFDDTLIEKPNTSENEIIMYHYDHAKGRYSKGICMVTALYNTALMNIPVCVDIVKKEEEQQCTKNEMLLGMLEQCVHNTLVFKYVLADKWYASAGNMREITHKYKKDFIFPLKTNRNVKLAGSSFYHAIADLELEAGRVYGALLKGFDDPVYIARYEIKDGLDNSCAIYLVTSDEKLTWDDLLTCYQKRWQVELFHRSIKQNAAIGKAPLHAAKALISHCYASLRGYLKLELIKIRLSLAHDSIKQLIRHVSNKAAYESLEKLSTIQDIAYKQLNLFA